MFNIFDPIGVMGINVNLWFFALVIPYFPRQDFLAKARIETLARKRVTSVPLFKEFAAARGLLVGPGVAWVTFMLFIHISTVNLTRIFPYVFTSTSHPVIALTIALPLWVGYMVIYTYYESNSIIAHFLPLGTPLALWPLIVCVEIVRSVIRPFTLSIRLVANMVAGHLLLGLIRRKFSINLRITNIILPLILLPLVVLELAVRVIQGYVFGLLSTLYVREAHSKNLYAASLKS